MTLLREVFDFGQPEARLRAFVILLVAALVSPDIPLPGGLPAVRLEQIALAVFLPSLALYLWRQPRARTLYLVDLAFLVLAGALTLTLLVAPVIVDGVGRSYRDVFELARPAEYWLLFRLGLTVVPELRTWKATATVLLGAAVGLTTFSLLQYLNPGNFNSVVTDLWATAHNLEGVERRGRVLGTTGNANYYGILSGFFLVFALAIVLLREHLAIRYATWIAGAAASAGVLSLVMSQSRTATLAVLGAMALGLALVWLQRRGRAAYGTAIGIFVGATIASVAFVEAVPPQFGSFHERFAPAALTEDSSLTIRLSRWQSVFASFLESTPDICEGEPMESRPIAAGHDYEGGTGAPAADADARARDEQRKDDVAEIADAIVAYFCVEGVWPADGELETLLVPDHLDEMPVDPATGESYLDYVTGGGIMVGAELENPADPEGPVYTLGTIPNFVLNPSFTSGGDRPASWMTSGTGLADDAVAERVDDGLFGDAAVEVAFPPGGALYQNVVYAFPVDTPFTASAWVRSVSGEEEEVQIYLVGQTLQNEVIDPLAEARTTVPADGSWTPVSLRFDTPAVDRLQLLRFLVRSDQEARVQLDGTTLTRGPFPASFHRVTNTDPAALAPDDRPGFSDSPLLGVGPRKDLQVGSVDNEYVLFMESYGAVGTLAYLAMWVAALAAVFRTWMRGTAPARVFALSLVVFIFAVGAYNVAAGSYYHFQIMAVFWLLVGVVTAAGTGSNPPGEEET